MGTHLSFFDTAWIVFQEQYSLFPEEEGRFIRIGDHVSPRDEPRTTLGIVSEICCPSGEAYIITPQWMVDRDFRKESCGLSQEGWVELSEIIHSEGYSIEELATAIYGNSFHTYYNVKRSYFSGWKTGHLKCQHKECRKVAVGVGLINFLGSIMPFAMCQEHTNYHGMCGEYVPFEGKIKEVVYG